MPELRPFRGIRYTQDDLDAIACPPYDVISPEQQQALYDKHEHNAVRLELAQTEGEPHDYSAVNELFTSWLAEKTLAQDPRETLYVYRQDFSAPDGTSKHVAGVIGALTLEPFGEGVLPHERTMPGPIEDRLALMRACPVNISPIFGIYRGRGSTDDLLASVQGRTAVASATDDAGVTHRLWAVTDPDEIAALTQPLASVPLVIADGHHRYETAVAYAAERGTPESARMMVVLVSTADPGLEIFPTHRVFAGRSDITPEGVEYATVQEAMRALESEPYDRSSAVVVRAGRAALVHGEPGELDVELVDRFGHDGISYTPSLEDAVSAVDRGGADVAFLLRPTRIEDVFERARRGEVMPQKTTYFYPKLISGLLFHPV